MFEGLSDTSFLWSKLNENQLDYYVDNYIPIISDSENEGLFTDWCDRVQPYDFHIGEDLFSDLPAWVSHNRTYWARAWPQNFPSWLHSIRIWNNTFTDFFEFYTPNHWSYMNSLKDMDQAKSQTLQFFYVISESYYEYITPFNSNDIVHCLEYNQNKNNWNRDLYDINFLKKRELDHHDFVVGQHLTTSEYLNNPMIRNSNNIRSGFHILWYERFGMVELWWKLIYTNWNEINSAIWWDDWAVSTQREIYYTTTSDYGHFIIKQHEWLRDIKDCSEHLSNKKAFTIKGINMYFIDETYAKINKKALLNFFKFFNLK